MTLVDLSLILDDDYIGEPEEDEWDEFECYFNPEIMNPSVAQQYCADALKNQFISWTGNSYLSKRRSSFLHIFIEDVEKKKEVEEKNAVASFMGAGKKYSAARFEDFDEDLGPDYDPVLYVIDEDVELESGAVSYTSEIQCISAFLCTFLISGLVFQGNLFNMFAAGIAGLFIMVFRQVLHYNALHLLPK